MGSVGALVTVLVFIEVARAGILTLQTCCDDIEQDFCFPDNGLLRVDPQCPSTFSPTFTLFTRDLSTSGVSITKDSIPSAFSNDKRTAFIVHGWIETFHSAYQEQKDELLKKEDLNVIGVDWRYGAASPTYIQSAANTEAVGALIGAIVNVLRTQPGSKPYFWCIGHSLGSHVCGFTNLTARPVFERITGLDPAGPYFDSDIGLTKDSASKVDIIHTDIIFGSLSPRGHVDFYPNGGRDQPGCSPTEILNSIQITLLDAVAKTVLCSHQRSVQYMTNSIKDPSCYVAKQVCDDYNNIPGSCRMIPSTEEYGVMGYDAIDNRYHGYLYFAANTSAPYCAID